MGMMGEVINEAMPTAPDALVPPSPQMTITKHELIGGAYAMPLFYMILDADAEATYRASTWVYVPSSYQGSDISLIFHGNAFVALHQADLGLRDQWQEISVTATSAAGQRELAPSLTIAHSSPGTLFSAGWRVTKVAPHIAPAPPRKSVKNKLRRTYQVLPIEAFLREHPEVQSRKCLDGCVLEIAPISFGDMENPGFECTEHPESRSWGSGQIEVPNIYNYTLHDAVLHGESGVVTVGDQLVLETLKLPSYEDFEISWEGENLLSLPGGEETLSVGHGAHLFCGYPGTRNYSHFLVDILSAAFVPPFGEAHSQTTLLCSHLYKDYQKDYLRYFPEFFSRALFVKGQTKINCASLDVSSFSLINSHYTPHPYHREVLRGLAARISGLHPELGADYPEKIYVDRRDSSIRGLMNESEVIRCVERNGFTPVSLTGLSVPEQVLLFSRATHIIAPHGAGSTNILFSNAGTSYLELLMDKYVQWSMRRMNSLVPIRYGCVIGCEIPTSVPPSHNQKWFIRLDRLERAIASMLATS